MVPSIDINSDNGSPREDVTQLIEKRQIQSYYTNHPNSLTLVELLITRVK